MNVDAITVNVDTGSMFGNAASYWKKLLLALASLLLTMFCLEIYLRIFPDSDFQTNNVYRYTKKIGEPAFQEPFHSMKELYPLQFDKQHYYEKSNGIIHYDLNQLGARWLRAEPQDSVGYNVFVLGDSFTMGFGLRYEDTYIFKLQDQLRKQKLPINFWNFAAPDSDSRKCLSIYRKCSDRIHHGLVLYGLHLNDLIEFPTSYVNTLDTSRTTRALARRSKLVEFILKKKNNYLDRGRRIRELTSPDVFRRPYFQENLQAIIDLDKDTKKNGRNLRIVLLPILVDLQKDTFRPVYQTILGAMKSNRIKYYDLTGVLPPRKDSEYWILPFDQHPNEKANAIFADQLTSMMLQDDEIQHQIRLSH